MAVYRVIRSINPGSGIVRKGDTATLTDEEAKHFGNAVEKIAESEPEVIEVIAEVALEPEKEPEKEEPAKVEPKVVKKRRGRKPKAKIEGDNAEA